MHVFYRKLKIKIKYAKFNAAFTDMQKEGLNRLSTRLKKLKIRSFVYTQVPTCIN